jgi:tetratricopeptide (TPR) repeat protein
MWVHLYDAHDPYDPPEPYKSKYAAAPYDGEIAYVDSEVGKFLDELRAGGLYDGAAIAVMADHGESLGDHGEEFHGFFLYDETIRVPLVIKLPHADSTGKFSAGSRIDNRVGLVDVLPTILQAAGVAVPKDVQGESLLGIMSAALHPPPAESGGPTAAAQIPPDRPAYAESEYGRRAYGWSSVRALRAGKYLYIDAPRPELYDQTADSEAEHNLFSTSAAVAGTLAPQLDTFLQKTSNRREAPKPVVDPEAQERLAALGYVATSNTTSLGARGEDKDKDKFIGRDIGADPKDKIQVGNLIHRANFLAEDGNFEEAVPLLRQLIAKEPGMALLYTKLGQCLVGIGEFENAVPVLRTLVALSPDSADAHFQLGMALLKTQDFAGAVPELEIVARARPRWERGRLLLATAYVRAGRLPDAMKECKKVLEFSPEHYGANLFMGRVLLLSGDAAAALANLKKAAALQPTAREPHMFLKDAYLQLGRRADAAREQAEAESGARKF